MSNGVLSIVSEVIGMLQSIPEARGILDKMRDGTVDQETAMAELMKISLMAGQGEALLDAAGRMKMVLGVESLSMPVTVKHANGMTVMNPIMEAAIAERASIDGDVPELRTGPMPDGSSPAVPILTDAMNPVMVGMQLEVASKEVSLELERENARYLSLCKEVQGIVDSKPDKELAMEVMGRYLPSPPTGVKGYEAGRLPVPRQVKIPDINEMSKISPVQASVYAYKAIATTQGRNSLCPVIEREVKKRLGESGITILESEPSHGEDLGDSRWSTNLWGPEDVSADFNPIMTAIGSIVEDVQKRSEGYTSLWVRIRPINEIADRNFGWLAKIKGTK